MNSRQAFDIVDGKTKIPSRIMCLGASYRPVPSHTHSRHVDTEFAALTSIRCRLAHGQIINFIVEELTVHTNLLAVLPTIYPVDRPLYIFGYDLPAILSAIDFWDWIEFREAKIEHLTDDDPPFVLRVRDGKQTLVFLDVRNWFRQPMSQLQKDFARADFASDLPAERITPSQLEARQEAITVANVMSSWFAFITEHRLGEFANTVSAQAMRAYRYRFAVRGKYDGPVIAVSGSQQPEQRGEILPKLHKIPDVMELERDCNYPGETSAFFIGRIIRNTDFFGLDQTKLRAMDQDYQFGPCFKVDFRSFYPTICAKFALPCSIKAIHHDVSLDKFNSICANSGFAARVVISSKTEPFPLRHGGLVLHCTGDFATSITTSDILSADRIACIKSVPMVVEYNECLLLTEYASTFLSLRNLYESAHNVSYAQCCKLMANSLIGKFSQRNRAWRRVAGVTARKTWGSWTVCDYATKQCTDFRAIAGNVQVRESAKEYDFAMPIVTAYVQALGRALMRAFREIVGPKNCWYQATDCMILSQEGFERLDNAVLRPPYCEFPWKLEGIYETGQINGYNNYQLGDQIKIAGLPDQHTVNESGEFSFMVRQKLATMLATKPTAYVRHYCVSKKFSGPYKHGVVSPEGAVRPWHVVGGELT